VSRILGLDVGAKRMGFAIVDAQEHYSLVFSGVLGIEQRAGETFHDYRWRLIRYWVHIFPSLLCWFPDIIASETMPIVNSGGPFGNTQRVLGLLSVTVCQTLAIQSKESPAWREIAANTVKKTMTNNAKATKVGVRNAVCEVFPELIPEKKTLVPDRTDAIAVALVGGGYKSDR